MMFRLRRPSARTVLQTSLFALIGCAGAGGGDDESGLPPGFSGNTPNTPSNVTPANPTPGVTPTPNPNPSTQPPSGTQPTPGNPNEAPNTPPLQPNNPSTPPAPGGSTNPSTQPNTGMNPGAMQPGNTPPQPTPPPGTGARIGAEFCPPGPFGAPLPANVQVEKLFSVGENNFFNFEGPVWTGDALYFSEIGGGGSPPPANINRFIPGGQLERGVIPDSGSNGLGLDAEGNLIAATHDVGAIASFTVPDGSRGTVGAQTFNGQRFNSPNDLVMRSDGNVYFTDPTFQAPGNPQGGTRVYRISPSGEASVVDASLSNPNGITLSLDEATLFVTSASGFMRYSLAADGTPSAGTAIQLDEPLQTPDGMAADCAGNIYTTEHFARRVRVFDPAGNEIGRFTSPVLDRDITNLAFGGADRRTLFITTLTQDAQGGVFAAQLNVPGLPY